LEDTVSRRAIVAEYAARGGGDADVAEIAARASAGDRLATDVLSTAFTELGGALAPWLATFGATVLVVGGAMAASWELIAGPLRRGMLASHPELAQRLVVVRARHGEHAALIGAALAAVGSGSTAYDVLTEQGIR
jgi:glucokinase